MKRNNFFLSGIVILLVLAFFACARQAKAPQAGQAKIADLLRLLPKETQGVFAWDVHRSLTTSVARRSLEDKEVAAKIREFQEQTGLDPEKDVFLLVGGLMPATAGQAKAVALINLRYDQEKILSLLKQKDPELKEIVYGQKTIYQLKEEKTPYPGIIFYDSSNIFFGEIEAVKAVIDVTEKKAESFLQNNELNSLIKSTNTNAMVWSAFLLPPEAMANLAKSNPMFSSVEHLRSLIMSFDYKNKNLVAEIKAMGGDEAQNKQVAEFLTGIRAMGSMAASKYPEAVEVLNRLEITSSPQHVSLAFSLPEDLLIKLGDRMKKEVEANLPKLKPKED
jgi:hypothetical protein